MEMEMLLGEKDVHWLQYRDALASTCLVYNEPEFSIEVGVLGCHRVSESVEHFSYTGCDRLGT